MKTIVLVALCHYRNMTVRSLHSMLQAIPDIKVHTVFFNDYYSDVFGMPTRKEEQLFIETLKSLHPSMLGINVLTPFVPIAANLTRKTKKHFDIPIVWGGIHPTIDPEDALKYTEIICRGEGEYAFREMAERLKNNQGFDGINNIWIKKGDTILSPPGNPLFTDLNALPFPAYSNSNFFFIENNQVTRKDIIPEGKNYYIKISRGCPFSCTFCTNATLRKIMSKRPDQKYLRIRSVDNVIEELKLAKKKFKNLKIINFVDEVFSSNTIWVKEFIRKYDKEISLPFSIHYNPCFTEIKILESLKLAGLKTVHFGIQSGSEEIRNKIFRRKGTNSEYIRLFNSVKSISIEATYDIILDNPYENDKTMSETLDFLLQLPLPRKLNVYSLCFFPNIAITEEALKDNLINKSQTSPEHILKKLATNGSWTYVPRILPLTRKNIYQNIIKIIPMRIFTPKLILYSTKERTIHRVVVLSVINILAVLIGRLKYSPRGISFAVRKISYLTRKSLLLICSGKWNEFFKLLKKKITLIKNQYSGEIK